MVYRDINNKRKCQREWYSRNKLKQKEWVKSNKLRIKEWYRSYKESLCCEICGESDYRCLDFHHTEDNKEQDVSIMVHSAYSIESIMEEISKCQVVCANCHRRIHFKE